jgi:hypothetical protein
VHFRRAPQKDFVTMNCMGRDPQPLSSFHHIVVRGSRKMNIVHDDNDRWNLLRMLFYMNDSNYLRNWERSLSDLKVKNFAWPGVWPEQQRLVYILAFCLHDNHLHLLVKQAQEHGISQFMKRFGSGFSIRYNKKYEGSGSVFQGKYRSRIIKSDTDLREVAQYVMTKNVFERYPNGGLRAAERDFEKAYAWALTDSFSSFCDYAGGRKSPIVTKDLLEDLFPTPFKFKREARDYLIRREEKEEVISRLLLE